MSQGTFSREIAVEVLRRAMQPGGEFYALHEHSLAVVEHVRKLGIVGLIVVDEPFAKHCIHVSSITPAGEAMLAWLGEPEARAALPVPDDPASRWGSLPSARDTSRERVGSGEPIPIV
jgi:hypothetical protein